MLHRLIAWALNNPLIIALATVALGAAGGYAFVNINVEAYPDPAPSVVEVIAQYPGASAEDVERQVTIPLEVTLAGMPGLKSTRTRSLFGLSNVRCQFEYGVPYEKARQEVINRLQFIEHLPGEVRPVLSPTSPTGEIYRYTIAAPKDEAGRDVYALTDLKALQDWTLEREFRRVPRVVEVTSAGGAVKRYEARPNPDALQRYGVTLGQFQAALASANQNTGGDVLFQGGNAVNVRGLGLYGGGQDPMQSREVLGAAAPELAAAFLRKEEERRVRAIRNTVVTTINNSPVRVEDLVEGGPLAHPELIGRQGVVVGNQTRLGRVSLSSRRKGPDGKLAWVDEEEKIQCIVLLRKGEDSLPALASLHEKIDEVNDPASGLMLPGTKIEPYYDRTELIGITTETVRENLVVGVALVALILVVFLGNVRVALIVSLNIPLALLFAFGMLYARGRSANLLSIGAVDFGIIVDSSVLMAETIYRRLTAQAGPSLLISDRILEASSEIQRVLVFSTAIMVCAFIPLFAMKGAEGQLFGPMADTYAFALAGGLILAVFLTPVLCRVFLRNVRPTRDNALVRLMKWAYLGSLGWCLRLRWVFAAGVVALFVVTGVGMRNLGRELMPELEEGNLWVRGMYPRNASLDVVADGSRAAREVFRRYPEVELIANQMGRPDDGTDPEGFYKSEFFVPLKPRSEWPAVRRQEGWAAWFTDTRPRTKPELIAEMTEELRAATPGVDWNFSQNIRDNVMESISGVKGDNSVKIFGPDLDELQRLAKLVEGRLKTVKGVEDVGVLEVMGQPNLEIPWDPEKCKFWGVSAADLQNVVSTAVGGQAATQMREGEKIFDVTVRWPKALRDSEKAILDIPVDIVNHQVSGGFQAAVGPTRFTGGGVGLSSSGSTAAAPSQYGSQYTAAGNPLTSTARRKLRDLVTPLGAEGRQSPGGSFVRPGASMIFREQGKRMIAVKFSVRGRDLAGAVDDARAATAGLITAPYREAWSGEFEQMKDSEGRLMIIIPITLVMIFVLLYMSFGSLLDAAVVLSNVAAVSVGGIWALLLTGMNFSTSAAVGFVSLFGVAIMGGLLLISSFNAGRAHGLSVAAAIRQGAEKGIRPVVMMGLTAILGLLPAALALRPAWDSTGHFRFIEPIGVQTQRPLAIVVVGGMLTSLALTPYLMPVLYSFYGRREPPAGSGSMAH